MNTESLNFADYKNCPQELVGRWVGISHMELGVIGCCKIGSVNVADKFFKIGSSGLGYNLTTGIAYGTSYFCALLPTPVTQTLLVSNYDKAECLWQDLKGIVMIAESGRLLAPEEIQICNDCLKNNIPTK